MAVQCFHKRGARNKFHEGTYNVYVATLFRSCAVSYILWRLQVRAVEKKMPITLLANATKVLLLTYYRGGSTFLGEIFRRNPEAFYWFEPLGGLLDKAYNKSAERLTKYRLVEDAVMQTEDMMGIE